MSENTKYDRLFELRRAAKARYDQSEKGQLAKRRAYERAKLRKRPRSVRSAEEELMAGVWYEDDPRAVSGRL